MYKGKIYGLKGQIVFSFSSYDSVDSKAICYIGNHCKELVIDMPIKSEISQIYPGQLDSYKREIDKFIERVNSGEHRLETLYQEFSTMQVLNASYESSKTRSLISIPLTGFDSASLTDCFKKMNK